MLPPKTTLAWLHFPSIAAATTRCPRPRRQRRHRGRADGRPGADRRLVQHARSARALEGAAARLGGAAGRVRRRRRTPNSTRLEAKASRSIGDGELIRGPSSPATPETIEVYWRVREGLHGLVGKLRLPGTALIVEDVCVPPARIAEGAADLQALLGRARLPHRRRRPRLGGQPALHADAGLRQARGPRALRVVHGASWSS